jgi:hypothetical protein
MSGCLTTAGLAETGFLSYKGIGVTWKSHGQYMSADVCWAWSDGETRIFGWVAEEYDELVESPTDIRVTRASYERLRRDFVDVTLRLGFSRRGATDHELLEGNWHKARVSRKDFNRVQFGDQVEVIFRFPRVHVVDTYHNAQGDPDEWKQELKSMDFSEMYKDRGVPI